MKVIKMTTDCRSELIDAPEKITWSWCAEQIGCEWIEVVRPRGFDFIMVVDEEGLLKENRFNYYGSYIYGTQIHHQPIVGDILIMDESDEGELVGIEDSHAEILRLLYETKLESIKKIFGENL